MQKVIEGDGYDVIKHEDGTYGYLINGTISGSYTDMEDAEFAAVERVSWLGFQDTIQYRIIDNWENWDLDDLLFSTAMLTYAAEHVWNDDLNKVHQRLFDQMAIEKWFRVIKFGITHWCPGQMAVDSIVSLNKTMATDPRITDIIVCPIACEDLPENSTVLLLTMLDKTKF